MIQILCINKPFKATYFYLTYTHVCVLHNISVSGHSDIKWGMIHIGITHLSDMEFLCKIAFTQIFKSGVFKRDCVLYHIAISGKIDMKRDENTY